jgi:Zn-dependent protease
VRPSPVFLGMLAAFAGAGYLCASGVGNPRVWVFAFVALGWTISLCLHEFAHAAVAWIGGDKSVEARGYLTLNPARYINSQTSIILPLLIVLIGGIALPGGAVMVDRRLIPERRVRSLVSAAGPLTNLLCAFACGLPLALHWVKFDVFAINNVPGTHDALAAALAFLALLEVVATVLNALPVPGLDGFGALAPYLPDETVARLMPAARYAWLALIMILLWSGRASGAFFRFCNHVLGHLGVNGTLAAYGQYLFTFWRH